MGNKWDIFNVLLVDGMIKMNSYLRLVYLLMKSILFKDDYKVICNSSETEKKTTKTIKEIANKQKILRCSTDTVITLANGSTITIFKTDVKTHIGKRVLLPIMYDDHWQDNKD